MICDSISESLARADGARVAPPTAIMRGGRNG